MDGTNFFSYKLNFILVKLGFNKLCAHAIRVLDDLLFECKFEEVMYASFYSFGYGNIRISWKRRILNL